MTPAEQKAKLKAEKAAEQLAMKQLAAVKKEAQAVLDKLDDPTSQLEGFIAKESFKQLPDIIKQRLEQALQEMIRIREQAVENANADVPVQLPTAKDVAICKSLSSLPTCTCTVQWHSVIGSHPTAARPPFVSFALSAASPLFVSFALPARVCVFHPAYARIRQFRVPSGVPAIRQCVFDPAYAHTRQEFAKLVSDAKKKTQIATTMLAQIRRVSI